ncbi:hypothetical protein CN630_19990 [Bacillus wiedmannii]|uniref:hypothetical protein n=1 Tax=Bacillus wiedmannii TaxID=1890302 RepID=UPI000BF739BA|nr:hypothetical protein [Bacillus wiedmannii]PEN45059.1 hypothetical protein CN630_19990 [Bacillus wiedmannii]
MMDKKNQININVDADNTEVIKKLKEITDEARNTVQALEQLADKINEFKTNSCICIDGKEIAKSLDKELAQLARVKENL